MRTKTSLLLGLICVVTMFGSLSIGRPGLAAEDANTVPSTSNFRADFPLNEVREKIFKNETVQLDGNEFINCTFDNVIFEFNGQAPFRFTNVHVENQSKIEIRSKNPVVLATLELM